VPLIVYDPSADADATRGTTCDALVESIDLPATFVEMAGGAVPGHILEGRSLLPLLHGKPSTGWREFAVSEYNYSTSPAAQSLGVAPAEARLFMIADHRWKFIHDAGGGGAMLFDLENDPGELSDLARKPGHDDILDLMYTRLAKWARRNNQRVTVSDADIAKMRKGGGKGILIGVYTPDEANPGQAEKYRGPVTQNHLKGQ
jgi:arylsulfatase A-like enzyme